MKKVTYVPLMPIPNRYTEVMDEEIVPFVDHVVRASTGGHQTLAIGTFMCPSATVAWQAGQLVELVRMVQAGQIANGDTVLFADMWFSGLEGLRYVLEDAGLDVCLAGWNHAGRADPDDFIQRYGQWAEFAEMARHAATDLVLVGSEFHRHRVAAYFRRPLAGVQVVGEVWSTAYVLDRVRNLPQAEKRDHVIWPHRLGPEKGVDEFFAIARALPERRFLVTSGTAGELPAGAPENITLRAGLTKAQYFQALRDGVYLSTAFQETFGYTLHEAIALGAPIVAPRRATYREFLPAEATYETVEQAAQLIQRGGVLVPTTLATRWDGNGRRAVELARNFKHQ